MTASRPAGQFTRERSRRFQPSGQCEFSFRYKPLLVSPQEVDPHDDGGHSDDAYNNSDPVPKRKDKYPTTEVHIRAPTMLANRKGGAGMRLAPARMPMMLRRTGTNRATITIAIP